MYFLHQLTLVAAEKNIESVYGIGDSNCHSSSRFS